MEVNVIFAEKVSVNEKNNFSLDFKDGNIVMALLLNRKKRLLHKQCNNIS